ncbi:uncharacterized protein LOC143571169 [Bidens hawaiensis]|uniref:uncharacterized protein LOC143571169 n=1 Tax=Bidens hawaiensis TaxID=980011 RepID=UPI00404ACD65
MNPDVNAGTFLINDVYAKVLFDSGANQSFINTTFFQALNQPLTKLNQVCMVETADGNFIHIREVHQEENIYLLVRNFKEKLLPMKLAGFNFMLGMNWLTNNLASILCNKNSVEIRTPTGEIITIQGDKVSRPTKSVSVMKAANYLRKQGIVYMISVIIRAKIMDLKETPVLSEYPKVFPEDFPGQPPDREIEFRIHVTPENALVAKATYRLVPIEMLELKRQLDELLEKGFIGPSSSP